MLAQTGTVPLYYEDLYRTGAEVWVDALVEDERFGRCLLLSETLCHPHGGGQKGDRAKLVLTAEEAAALGLDEPALPILDTRKDGGRILHIISAPQEAAAVEAAVLEETLVGTRAFALELDWPFRQNMMRLHSTAHLLHCLMERELGQKVPDPQTSDLQPAQGLNRYEIAELVTPEQMERIVVALNAFTAEGHAIRTYPDESREGFRYWQCEDWVIPCGGTHPANSSEIGPVAVKLSLKRGRTSMAFTLAE